MSEKTVRVGIACWVFNPAGLVLLGKRLSKHGFGTWAPPGGHLEFGESPTECASRELFEETGIFIPNTHFHQVDITNDIFPDRHYITIHYRADSITATPILCEPDKCEMWKWFNPNNVPQNLFSPAEKFIMKINAELRKNQRN